MERETIPDVVYEAQPQFYGEGDTYLVPNLLPNELASTAFERIKDEVQWQTMHHHGWSLVSGIMTLIMTTMVLGGEVPRLVAVEGQINQDGR